MGFIRSGVQAAGAGMKSRGCTLDNPQVFRRSEFTFGALYDTTPMHPAPNASQMRPFHHSIHRYHREMPPPKPPLILHRHLQPPYACEDNPAPPNGAQCLPGCFLQKCGYGKGRPRPPGMPYSPKYSDPIASNSRLCGSAVPISCTTGMMSIVGFAFIPFTEVLPI